MKINFIVLTFLILISCNNRKNKHLQKITSSNNELEVTPSNDSLLSNLKNDESNKEMNNEPDFEELGYELMESETIKDLKLDLDIKQVEESIGVASELSKNEVWSADAEYHQTYFYENLGIELNMVGDKMESKKVNMISIHAPCKFKTSKGIAIGSTLTDLEREYGKYYNKDFSSDETFVAGSIYGGVIFTLKNNLVESIFIGAKAE